MTWTPPPAKEQGEEDLLSRCTVVIGLNWVECKIMVGATTMGAMTFT